MPLAPPPRRGCAAVATLPGWNGRGTFVEGAGRRFLRLWKVWRGGRCKILACMCAQVRARAQVRRKHIDNPSNPSK